MKEIGQRLRLVRNHLQLKQQEFADMFEIDRSTVSLIENGKILPSTKLLIELQKHFRISTNYILYQDGSIFLPEDSPDSGKLKLIELITTYMHISEKYFESMKKDFFLRWKPLIEKNLLKKIK